MEETRVERNGRVGVDYASLRARRAELDWLLVDKCVMHGERNSLKRLWLMRDICAVANTLNRTGRVTVSSMVVNNKCVAVRVTCSWKAAESYWYFSRRVVDASLKEYDSELRNLLEDLRELNKCQYVLG